MEKLKIKIKLGENSFLPIYKTEGSSGMDLSSSSKEDIVLKPLERKLVPTGISMSIPKGYEAQIRPRSGLAIKEGITVLNSPGTVDSDFVGEIKVILINLSDKQYIVRYGDRIAQMVIAKIEDVGFESVDILEDTERGSGGFGHTGI